MELKDLFLTPLYLIVIYGLAYWARPMVTNKTTRKYYFPALTVKLIGAIAIGLIYQFYYGGGVGTGDTFNYFRQAGTMQQAFWDSPAIWLKLMLSQGKLDLATLKYSQSLYWYRSLTEFTVIKIASVFSILSFHTYSVVALFFAFISFTGMWQMYRTFLKLYPSLHKKLAIAIFFVPSVFFWGSGLLKDSLAIGALGWVFYGFYALFIEKKHLLKALFFIGIGSYVLYSIKIYILLAFLPPALLWIFNENNKRIKSYQVRTFLRPFFIATGIGLAILSATGMTDDNSKYDIENLAEQSKINSLYLAQQVTTGSAYDIGIFDGSLSSLASVGPRAIVVSLYRPFLWEVRNPFMLLSSLEAAFFIYLTLWIFYKGGFWQTLKFVSTKPILSFCFIFTLIMAFGVATNSGNFGTLVRYKIPFMPFYTAALFILQAHLKKPKKVSRLAATA